MTAAQLPGKAQQILSGEAPEKLRKGIAAGLVPLPPDELVSALAVLIARDPDPALRKQAQKTLVDLPAGVRLGALKSQLAPPVFRVLARLAALSRDEREALMLNPAVPDDVLVELAQREDDANLLEILAGNQAAMLREVRLVEALLDNPSLGPAMKARLEEFFSRAYAGKLLMQQGLATREELEQRDDYDQESLDAAESATMDGAAERDPVVDELIHDDDDDISDEEEAERLIASAAGDAEELIDMSNLRKALQQMTVPQKIKLALMGGKEARSLLVIDPNKIVSSMVLKNPRISDKEILAIAKSKSVREDMLRAIARDRKFMKSYNVKVALVENPKTPVALAMQLLPQLRDADLKRIARSKSVSNNIATQAKRIVMRKQK